MTLSAEVLAAAGAILSPFLGYYGAKVAAKSTENAKRIEANSPAWDSFTGRIMQRMDDQEKEIQSYREENRSLAEQMQSLRTRVDDLQKVVDETRTKYQSALRSLRRIFNHDREAIQVARLSNEVRLDVFKD